MSNNKKKLLETYFFLVLKIANKVPKKIPNTNETETNFIVIIVALNNLGKLKIIKSKSINIPFDRQLLIC